jgi:TolB-like protein/predicted esterase
MKVLSELKRRKVYQVAAIYAAAAWGLLQVADLIFPRLGLPDWSVTFLFALEVVGFPLALILSWIFDFTPGGMVRTARLSTDSRTTRDRRSLAVLPFSNMSGDRALDHLSDGLTEDLITRLQGHVGIPVNSRNSCFVYRNVAVDIPKVSEELGAAWIVEGSVRVQGEVARVTAQLIHAATDHHVWAEKYDRPAGDIFALQDELVEAMAAAIGVHIETEPSADPGPDETADQPVGIRKRWVALSAVLVLGLAGLLTWSLEQRGTERWAREVALPEIEELVLVDDTIGAFRRIAELEPILPSDPLLLKYRDQVSVPATIVTEPSAAGVSYKAYFGTEPEWIPLGITPLRDVRLPRGYLVLKFAGEGIVTTERLVRNPTDLLNNFSATPAVAVERPANLIRLADTATAREGMVYIDAWSGYVPLPNYVDIDADSVPAFYMDAFEVTNARFQEFVDADGYHRGIYWDGLDFGGQDWSEAVAAFTDQTGEPGPAGWERGRFRPGDENLPVTGVSWFEAAAYARFAGKQLPTLSHWYRAALNYQEVIAPLAPAIIKQSNFGDNGLAPVGQYPGLGFYGAYDMGGNAREWLWNADGDMRWIAGGAWNQVPYMFLQGDYESPWDRGPTNGFRCMANADGRPNPASLTTATNTRYEDEMAFDPPVDDATFAIYREQFGYLKQDLKPQLLSSRQRTYWREELIHITSPYSPEGMDLLLMLPDGAHPPLQALILMPGSDVFYSGASLEGYDWNDYEPSVAIVLRSGRAVVLPVWEGAFSRGLKRPLGGGDEVREWLRSTALRWRQDLGSALDYLQTRDDIDSDRIGFLGISRGAGAPLSLLAVEPRLKAAVLVAGGLMWMEAPPSVQPKNFAPRITLPVLMLNGRYDQTFSLETHQKTLFELLGADASKKKHVLFDSGHVGYPVSQQRREILEWLDAWLGPVR